MKAENENEQDDPMLGQMQQHAAMMAMNAAHSYYKSAQSLIIDGGHANKEAVWQNPIWWTQMMMMILLEEVRSNTPGGKLPRVLSQNVRVMLDAVDDGTALFQTVTLRTHTKQ